MLCSYLSSICHLKRELAALQYRPLDESAFNQNLFSYCSTKTHDVPYQQDGSFEHPKQMFKLMDKKILNHNFKLKNFDYMDLWQN